MLLLLPRGWRERLLFKAPAVLTTYPYETLIAISAVCSGIPLTLGVARPGSIIELLPPWVAVVWGITLLVAGLTMAVGLLGKGNLMILASAHRLLSTACLVYFIAIVTTGGAKAMFAGAMLLVVCLMSSFRAFYMRTSVEVYKRIVQISEETASAPEPE